jgi:hypothetical protein
MIVIVTPLTTLVGYGVLLAVAGSLGQGMEHSGASGPPENLAALFGFRAVFLARDVSQKYN